MKPTDTITRRKLGRAAVAVGGAAAGAFGLRRPVAGRRWRATCETLRRPAETRVRSESLLDGLPDVARRYLRHAIAPDTPLARSVALRLTGRMKPAPESEPVDLVAEEILTPPRGFTWEARARFGPVPVRVRDHYLDGEGGVRVEILGLIPVGGSEDSDVARSSRHRLAAEAVWLPAALLPGPGVVWEDLDDARTRVALTVDGEAIPLTLHVDETGALRQVSMMRYGDVGVEAHQLIPYGFTVEAERTFDGYTIPTRLRGGWWFGADRYDPEAAAFFEVQAADFGLGSAN